MEDYLLVQSDVMGVDMPEEEIDREERLVVGMETTQQGAEVSTDIVGVIVTSVEEPFHFFD